MSVLQGLKARNFIHSKIEENIKKKLQESDKEPKHRDALQQLIDSSSRNGEQLSMQVVEGSSFPTCENEFSCLRERSRDGVVSFSRPQAIKESATELLFGGHETTASTATSLIMFLGLNPQVVDRLRQELMDKVVHSVTQAAMLKMHLHQVSVSP